MAKDVPSEIARLSARKLSASMSCQNPNENQDAINAAMKAFVTPTPGKPSDNDDASQGIEVNDIDSKDASNQNLDQPLDQGLIEQDHEALNKNFTGIKGSLYEQFGGDAKMNMFVEDFMEGIMGDADLACYHAKF